MRIEIPDHAINRGRERMGLNKKAMQRQATLAFNKGIKHGDTKGRLKKFIDKEALRFTHKANYYIYYNNHLFFFREISDDRILLLSMIKVPQQIINNLNNYIK